ncbi:hypothetical protein OH76DRAFT_1557505 [Lentinus brumalis]|uniref:Protein kinase domain-containing protein n=1 Tax=Lentinus brumalis TaxID=2498619 RepID=A0A371D5V2_9APHY|nr:hypothetical protein OH76DRAFT_1557505 [Polyporus brumalis]
MGSVERFEFDDEAGKLAYLEDMIRWRESARSLSPGGRGLYGSTYTISLHMPDISSCANSSSTRPLPALSFGVATQYKLVCPLQTGEDRHAEVWLAAPASGDQQDAPKIVFKFVVPSQGDLPTPDLDHNGIYTNEQRPFLFPHDMVQGEVASYIALADLQGGTLPYFFGVHEVIMPWKEPTCLLALEYIQTTPRLGSLDLLPRLLPFPEIETKYRDVALYKGLFMSALHTLRSAHARNICHGDVRGANIPIDEAHDQAVFIDWTSTHYMPSASLPYQAYHETHKLVLIFREAGIKEHRQEIRRLDVQHKAINDD